MSSLPLAALGEGGAFRCDPRFRSAPAPQAGEPDDPVARAWAEGYAAGAAEAEAEAARQVEAEDAARTRLALSLARLDAEQAEALRQKLTLTVEGLCAAAIAPLALDRDWLAARIARAAALLARADDDKVLRLHPDDLALVATQLPADLAVQPDPALERGALRIETGSGGVEDGPAHWRRAIAEALAQC